MRPLAGVVTGREGQTLVIELESGLTVRAPKKEGLKFGTRVWVGYDFTRRKVTSIDAYQPDAEIVEDDTIPVEPEGEHGDDDDTDEQPVLEDSGALPPCSDLWEFWDSDSGVLELS